MYSQYEHFSEQCPDKAYQYHSTRVIFYSLNNVLEESQNTRPIYFSLFKNNAESTRFVRNCVCNELRMCLYIKVYWKKKRQWYLHVGVWCALIFWYHFWVYTMLKLNVYYSYTSNQTQFDPFYIMMVPRENLKVNPNLAKSTSFGDAPWGPLSS